MALIIKEDLERGAAAGHSLKSASADRFFGVWGLSTLDPWMRPIVAKEAQGVDENGNPASIPLLNTRFPDAQFSYLRVKSAETVLCENDYAQVHVHYGWDLYPKGYLKTVSGMLKQIPLYFDNNNQFTTVVRTPTGGSALDPIPVQVTRTIQDTIINFRFLQTIDPEWISSKYRDAVNQFRWRGYPPRTLKLLPITSSTEDGIQHEITYSFHYSKLTHDEWGFAIDPNTGFVFKETATDTAFITSLNTGSPDSGNGWKRFHVYPEYNYDQIFSFIPQDIDVSATNVINTDS